MSLPARPSDVVALFEHLAAWGEAAAYEVEAFRAGPWVPVFENAGALRAVHDDHGYPVAWHLTPSFVQLLEGNAQQLGRRLCFAVPVYRTYLLSILVEGLVDAAHAGMLAELEGWTMAELAPLLREINAFIEPLEGKGRLVDLSPSEFEAMMANLPERSQAFSEWDNFALGHSSRPKSLFEFVLRRFASLSAPLPAIDRPAAALRALPLNREDGYSPSTAFLPTPWNTRRYGVVSGVAVVDSRGRPLFDEDAPLKEVLVDHLRDALLQHPFYAAVIHLAICAWRSPASAMPALEIYVPVGRALHDASLLLGARSAGRVSSLLGDLVRVQGYEPLGLVDGRVPDELMGNLMRNLLELRVLRPRDELIVLEDEYRASLVATRLRSVFRPGKKLQRRMVEELAQRAAARSEA